MIDIPKYTTVADVLIGCLVKSELLEATIPAKVMSYFAAGKPMVLAMDGEVQDLVNQVIKCGFASAAEDTDTLYQNIKRIYAMTPDERKKIGQRGRSITFGTLSATLFLGNSLILCSAKFLYNVKVSMLILLLSLRPYVIFSPYSFKARHKAWGADSLRWP